MAANISSLYSFALSAASNRNVAIKGNIREFIKRLISYLFPCAATGGAQFAFIFFYISFYFSATFKTIIVLLLSLYYISSGLIICAPSLALAGRHAAAGTVTGDRGDYVAQHTCYHRNICGELIDDRLDLSY